MRIKDDGTNIKIGHSADGVNFIDDISVATVSYPVSTYSQIITGIYVGYGDEQSAGSCVTIVLVDMNGGARTL